MQGNKSRLRDLKAEIELREWISVMEEVHAELANPAIRLDRQRPGLGRGGAAEVQISWPGPSGCTATLLLTEERTRQLLNFAASMVNEEVKEAAKAADLLMKANITV